MFSTARLRSPRVVYVILLASALTACGDVPTTAPTLGDSPAGLSADFARSTVTRSTSLNTAAQRSGRYYGTAIQAEQLTDSRSLIKAQVGALTTEYQLQWWQTEGVKGVLDYSKADKIVDFARTNHLRMRGHALIWHTGLPSWLPAMMTPANADSLMSARIASAAGRYVGKIDSWDVVNEAIEPYDGQPGGMRNTLWLRAMGPNYVARAFFLARKADPYAQLVLNEYNLESDAPDHAARRTAVLQLLRDLKAQGAPIDALGIQAHINPTLPMNPSVLTQFLNDVAALGLKIIVTEMDVTDRLLPADVAMRDAAVADAYTRYLSVFLSHPAVEGVMSWGLLDRNSWLANDRPRTDGLPVRPLLFDDAGKTKASWNATVDAFDRVTR